MDNTVAVALIVAVSSTVSPLLLAYLTNRNRRQQRAEDYLRQDLVAQRAREVADQAVKAAKLLVASQDAAAAKAAEAADLLLAANERVAATSVVTNNKLDVIHTLVNSNLTASMQGELDSTVRELAMMREVVSLKQAQGHDPSIETLAAIKATDTRISELRASLADRLKAL